MMRYTTLSQGAEVSEQPDRYDEASLIEKQQDQAGLQASRTMAESIIASAPYFIYVFDLPTNRNVFASEGLRDVLGISPDELQAMGDASTDLIHPDDYASVVESVNRLRANPSEVMHELEYRLRHKDGSWRWVSDQARAFHQEADGTVSQILGTAIDITRRKQTETALAEREAQFRLLAERSTDMISCHSPDGTYLYVSPACRRLLGYEPQELLGQSAYAFFHPHDVPTIADGHSTQVAAHRDNVVTYRIRHRDGHYIWFETQSWTIEDEQGQVSEIQCSSRDITRRKELEEQLVQSQKLESVGRLAGGIAHDFNNLLVVIIGATELIEPMIEPQNPIREDLHQIRDAAERASELTRRLLTFARRQQHQPQVIDMNLLVQELNSLLKRLIGDNCRMQLKLDADPARILADQSQIEQVLVNLIVNARDAMPQGGLIGIYTSNEYLDDTSGRPDGSQLPAGDYVQLYVQDTGQGMSEEVLAHAFEPFYTTKASDQGTGLGLAVCYGIIQQHQGIISLHSRPGAGTGVRILLPAALPPNPGDPAIVALPRRLYGSESIIIAEGSKEVRSLVARILSAYGYAVQVAASGPELLAMLDQQPDIQAQLLLTDLALPGMSGQELAHTLRQRQPAIKTLYISGYLGLSETEFHPNERMLYKPFTPRVLLQAVRDLLETTT
jgi:PAS domain S-box-containing protein